MSLQLAVSCRTLGHVEGMEGAAVVVGRYWPMPSQSSASQHSRPSDVICKT